jgi:hypothetical protein
MKSKEKKQNNINITQGKKAKDKRKHVSFALILPCRPFKGT